MKFEPHIPEEDRLRMALERIERLPDLWDAPLSHSPGDEGEAAWAAVGSSAVAIARRALET